MNQVTTSVLFSVNQQQRLLKHQKLKVSVFSLLSSLIAGITTLTVSSSPAKAEFLPYRFVSGKESIRLDATTLISLEAIGLTLSNIDELVPPATGYEFAWPVVPPSTILGNRGTTFEFLFDQETDTFLPTSGTIEFSGVFSFAVDPTRYSLISPLELGELSVFFTDYFSFFAIDTVTTNVPILSVNTFSAPTVDVEAGTWFLEPIELIFTQEFSDFLVHAALTQETADQVASVIPGLKFGEARGDRGFVPLKTTSVPEPSSLLGLLMAVGTACILRKKH
ncbi:MAG: PEP-CTERM sorting domain-containing protein [Microcystis sp. M090S1]|jgi:hypothetical protein|uniref:PEP-CTERM sorting domain-containing protein n=1 Tax=Microcystis sp. M090S1 TaxID=2771135 RepID=UPI00258FEF11|nr:PEP-CTERM sorting domain-containing protein [Microcystis sp. M090S1]MCA2813439.1 PEP-CTERM sorting domain-containing protein [Microcystis sp. M090S1]